MAHQPIDQAEPKLPLTPDCDNREQDNPVKAPRLTMKMLHHFIRDLQHENLVLANRIADLERQLNEIDRTRLESAAALELPDMDADTAADMLTDPGCEAASDVLLPRSERHASQKKKKFFRAFWFTGLQ
jgi:hypothetical protein